MIFQGMTADPPIKQIVIAEQTYYKWRREYGGMRVNQANFTIPIVGKFIKGFEIYNLDTYFNKSIFIAFIY